TGATGALGRRLLSKLADPRVLARSPEKVKNATAFRWSSESPVPDQALEGASAIVNLAGEPVAEGRWTEEKKARIKSSRIDGTRRLVEAIARAEKRPQVLVSASAVGYYGSRGDEVLDERSTRGEGFLAEVCEAWEDEAKQAEKLGVRVVLLRIGVVLMRGDGFLGKLVPLFKTGLGGKLGDGAQWIPWIHADDIVGLVLHAIAHVDVRGPMNATAPTPATNAEITKALAGALHRPAFFPTPKLAVKVAFGELATVVLASQRVLPRVAEATGYTFRHTSLEDAIRAEI
ncbi:MAG: TIGR01777 family oxidoreductase, partial [Polyangiales bacterium]